jgi:hypothetical protein
MEKSPSAVVQSDRIPGIHEISGALVQRSLLEIFHSAPFRASKQSRNLLQYIADQSLAGHTELLKERLIGVNVFGRRPDYDTNEDPIVRARVAEVRKRLAQFYVGEGRLSLVRIELSPGSYLASFSELIEENSTPALSLASPTVEPSAVGSSADASSIEPRERAPLLAGFRLISLLLALMAVGVVGVVWIQLRRAAPIEAFWEPLLKESSPVLLYSGANAVYMLSSNFMNRYEATHSLGPLENQGREFVVPMSPEMKLGPSDLVGFKNEFVTLGDLSANVRVASLLALHRRRFDVRSGQDIAFSDLRQSPTVLIGAFNNSWTLELTGDLPFTFDRNLTIRDQVSRKQTWTPVFVGEGKVAVDYAVVTRMPRSKTGEALIAIAGITQSGTRAAAEFITDPEQVKRLVALAPRDWSQRNLQFVLQTKVVNDIPTAPVVVALKSW